MHPIVKAYFVWRYRFKRSLSDAAVSRDDWRREQREAWEFFRELRDTTYD